ncbi:hypothetical protein COCNU_08G004030 [Cocos nucifera]|uniref:Uncharacterized protein n=1 Tax=Cocos nucifera TaxID=13894 RepID=A0A8K0IHY1_COCNU|nr:hypothetical protein COCNU_08G004030 [Cocos nucifera]
MGAAILYDLLMEILIPMAAVVGIVFFLVQRMLVSKVMIITAAGAASNSGSPFSCPASSSVSLISQELRASL